MASTEEVGVSLEDIQNDDNSEQVECLVDGGKLKAWLEGSLGNEDAGVLNSYFGKRNNPPKQDALDYAVKNNKLDAACMLIEHGVIPSTANLSTAIQKLKGPMVKILLGFSQGETAIKHMKLLKDWNSGTEQTLFADLITHLPDIAEKVLDHCVDDSGEYNERDYNITFDCSFFDGKATNKCYRNLPCSCFWKYLSSLLSCKFKPSEDNCIGESEEEKDYKKTAHPLYKIMKSDNLQLLKHPVVMKLLDYKLWRFGWWLYYSNLLLYILLVCILISFILLLPNPQDPTCLSLLNNASFAGNDSDTLSLNLNCSRLDINLSHLTNLKAIALVLAIFRLIMELVQLYNKKFVGYLNDAVNWFELGCYISTIIFLFSVDGSTCYCPQTWEWEVGVVALALTWVVLILWLQTMHVIGLYVTTMIRIIILFIPVAVFGVLLIIGFGLSFFVLFYQPPRNENVNQQSSIFSTPVRAILSVISLTAGDVDIGGVFYSDSEENDSPGSQYESLSFIIWLAAVIIMSVLFNNMLVGLAVGEVRTVTDEARITTIKQRIKLVLTLQEQLPEFIHAELIQKKIFTVYPYTEHYFSNEYICLGLCRGLWQVFCLLVSFLCFNLNHMMHWVTGLEQTLDDEDKIMKQQKLRQSYRNVPELIRKTKADAMSEAEKGMGNPVTKQELHEMLNDLKRELQTLI